MKNDLTCEVVEDLLPSYVDSLTSEVTNEAVDTHLSQCDSCKKKMENMKKVFVTEGNEEEKKEIDFLKKTRRKNIKNIILSLVSVLLVILTAIIVYPYTQNEKLFPSDVHYNLEVQGNTFKLTVRPVDENMVIKSIDRESFGLGEYGIDIRGRKRSIFDKGENYVWENTYENIKSFIFLDKILWEDGENISNITSAVFKEKTPYIGDMSKNAVIAQTLMMGNYLGSFENKLTTAKEPYGWEFIFRDPYVEAQRQEKEQLMSKYAYVLLGIIGNLSEVTFSYEVIDYDGDYVEHTLKFTKQQASEFLGADIKKCSEDINTLQELIEKTELDKLPYVNNGDSRTFGAEIEEMIIFDIFSTSEENITNISFSCVEDSGFVGIGFEKEPFSLGKADINSLNFTNLNYELKNLGENLYSEERLGKVHFEFRVTVDYDKEYALDSVVELSAAFGGVYNFILSGNSEDGFSISQQ